MSRLANKLVAGYFPTPPSVVHAIIRHLKAPRENFRILDPCAGEGTAVGFVATGTEGTRPERLQRIARVTQGQRN